MSGQGRPLGQSAGPVEPISGMRVVLDARPSRSPTGRPRRPHTLAVCSAASTPNRSPASRSRSSSSRTSMTRPRATSTSAVVGRLLPPTRLLRSAAMTVDPFLLVAQRSGQRGAPSEAVPRRRLPRGRGQHAAVGVGAAGRRDAPRPRSVGARRRVPANARDALWPADPRTPPARRRRGHRRQRCRRRGGPPACCVSAATGSGSFHLPRATRSRPRVQMVPPSGSGSACPSATSSMPGGTTPARTRHPPARAGRAGQRGPASVTPRGGRVAATHPARRGKPRRPCGARPGRGT